MECWSVGIEKEVISKIKKPIGRFVFAIELNHWVFPLLQNSTTPVLIH